MDYLVYSVLRPNGDEIGDIEERFLDREIKRRKEYISTRHFGRVVKAQACYYPNPRGSQLSLWVRPPGFESQRCRIFFVLFIPHGICVPLQLIVTFDFFRINLYFHLREMSLHN